MLRSMSIKRFYYIILYVLLDFIYLTTLPMAETYGGGVGALTESLQTLTRLRKKYINA